MKNDDVVEVSLFDRRYFYPVLFIFIFLFTIIIFNGMINDWGRLSNGIGVFRTFLSEDVLPPDWTVLEPMTYPVCTVEPKILDFTCSRAWIGMIETLKIAFVATVFGTILSLPISLLAARNLNTTGVSYIARFVLASFRSFPSLIWGIFFVILVGIGPTAGVLAMTVYTVGYLGKLQYEAIEGMSKSPLEASEVMGLTKLETAFQVVLPESANDLISQIIFMFEYNFRHGTVIGLVGAGGIGLYIDTAIKYLQYDRVIAYLIIIFIVVLIMDFISIKIRSLFTEEVGHSRPKWLEVFFPAWMIKR